MTELELLAPARNVEIAKAAIIHGADAVYIAADRFGARQNAGNSLSDIELLVQFAHQFHARVYVTVNTILFDAELAEVHQLINDLYNIGVDAVIMQDLAILGMDLPPIALHASTQMHNISVEKVKFLENQGVSRVVLPREFSFSQIADFSSRVDAQIEVFVHGALCVCYSGQCFMSQAVSGRSANRGACAQPCRSAYNLIDADGAVLVRNRHLLSLKDLNLSAHLGRLIACGATVFKIEGRLKDIAYVKNITAYYSQLLNVYIAEHQGFKRLSAGSCCYNFTPDPERSFNRGFTTHFVFGRQAGQASLLTPKSIGKPLGVVSDCGNNWFCVDTQEVIKPGDGLCYFAQNSLKGFMVNKIAQGNIFVDERPPACGTTIYRNSDHDFDRCLSGDSARRSVEATIFVTQRVGAVDFRIVDPLASASFSVSTVDLAPANNPELALANLSRQLSKTGNTPISVAFVDVERYTSPVFMPISMLNEIRRKLLHQQLDAHLLAYQRPKRNVPKSNVQYPESRLDYRANVANGLSESVLHEAGATIVERAYELQTPQRPVALMTTRYCIKFELNLCPRFQEAKPTKQLFLENNGRKYPLVFDCANCQMKVMGDK